MKAQKIVICSDSTWYEDVVDILRDENIQKPLLVCGKSASRLGIYSYLMDRYPDMAIFSDYEPNPSYDSVVAGINSFKKNKCDGIIGIGGGSALDVAKCIKIYAAMDTDDYLHTPVTENNIKMIAVPTTAGTGSESTRYSIIYINGVKYSVTEDTSVPEYVFLDGSVITSLPEYQRKATMLDALSHAIESYWSVKSTNESKKYAGEAITKIFDSMKLYLENAASGNSDMLYAANLAGRAISITATTAAHALCYRPTKIFNIAHGHAVFLTLPHIWQYMIDNIQNTIDSRGEEYVNQTFSELAALMHFDSPKSAVAGLWRLMAMLEIPTTVPADEECIEGMTSMVDVKKLSSTPVAIDSEAVRKVYVDCSSLLTKL